jgi:predicted acyltransferase
VDVLRGLTIALMIVATYSGPDAFPTSPDEAGGCGWRVSGLVVPVFLWTIGLSLVHSLARRRAAGQSDGTLLRHFAVRSLLLFVVGLALGAMPCLGAPNRWHCLFEPRLFGIFERIAVAYAIAAPLVLWLDTRGRAVALALLVGGYQVLYLGLDVAANCDPNLRRNLASSIPAAGFVLAGALTQSYFRRGSGWDLRGLVATGAALLVVAVVGERWLPFAPHPLNASYFVFSTGIATAFLGLIGAARALPGAPVGARPFVLLGLNPLVAYLFSAVVWQIGHTAGVAGSGGNWTPIWNAASVWLAQPLGSLRAGSLAIGLLLLGATLLIAWLMARRNLIVRL